MVWDKFANYFDVEMRKIPMKPDRYTISADDVRERIDENTIAVGAVLGTTHIGESDPIEEINDMLVRIKGEQGWDIPLHVDGASGAFIAPFAEPDLRSTSASSRSPPSTHPATSTASSTRASAG